MKFPARLLWPLLALPLCAAAAPATISASQVGLGDVLAAALARREAAPGPAPFHASAWLAALPSLDATYLKSDKHIGTDETDVGLTLPIKSPYQRERDARLRDLGEELVAVDGERRRLYYSGLVREALWTARIAAERTRLAGEKVELLGQLLERQRALFEARDSSRYGLLLIRQQLADARLAQEDQRSEYQRWLQRFRELTGLAALPADIAEAPLQAQWSWENHPELRRLDLGWAQQKALIAAGSERSAPWNVRLGAKKLDSPLFEENQYGLSVEIPLGFMHTASQSSNSEWREAASQHWRARDELQLALAQSLQQLESDAAHLERRQALLDEAAKTSAQLLAESDALLELNELGREIWVNRFIADLDRRAEASINHLLIGQNRAMSRQAAGFPL